MGCNCTKQSFRFKNLVVDVYPANIEDDVKLDALGKLRNYVAANPERIPRVCRKVSKLVAVDLAKGRMKRVDIGVLIMKDLIDHATELDYLVQETVDMASTLLAVPVPEHHIHGADLINLLTFHLAEKASLEYPRRLIAESQEALLTPLGIMSSEGTYNSDVISLHCRYAALVAIGNIAASLQSRVVDKNEVLVSPFLQNLLLVMKRMQQATAQGGLRTSSSAAAAAVMPHHHAHTHTPGAPHGGRRMRNDHIIVVPPDAATSGIGSVMLAVDAERKDVFLLRACIRGIAALASCCTTAAATHFLQAISSLIDEIDGWALEQYPCEVFRCITQSFQRRPHPLGFAVCQHLVELYDAAAAAEAAEAPPASASASSARLKKPYAIVIALKRSVEMLPLSGGRPTPMFEFVKRILKRQTSSTIVSGIDTSTASTVAEAAVELLGAIARGTARASNRNQLLRMLVELCGLLTANRHHELVDSLFRSISVVLSSLPSMTNEERRRVSLFDTLRPYLNAGEAVRGVATSSLVLYIAHCCLPLENTNSVASSGAAGRVSSSGVGAGGAAAHSAAGSATPAQASRSGGGSGDARSAMVRLGSMNSVSSSSAATGFDGRPDEVAAVCSWLGSLAKRTDHSAQSITAMGNVVVAMLYVSRWSMLPWVLGFLFDTQDAIVERVASGAAPTAVEQGFHNLCVAILNAIGWALDIHPLNEYAADVQRRRYKASPCEIGSAFDKVLDPPTPHRCGLRPVASNSLHNVPAPPVMNLISRGTVAVYMQRADAVALCTALRISALSQIEPVLNSISNNTPLSASMLGAAASAPTPSPTKSSASESVSEHHHNTMAASQHDSGMADGRGGSGLPPAAPAMIGTPQQRAGVLLSAELCAQPQEVAHHRRSSVLDIVAAGVDAPELDHTKSPQSKCACTITVIPHGQTAAKRRSVTIGALPSTAAADVSSSRGNGGGDGGSSSRSLQHHSPTITSSDDAIDRVLRKFRASPSFAPAHVNDCVSHNVSSMKDLFSYGLTCGENSASQVAKHAAASATYDPYSCDYSFSGGAGGNGAFLNDSVGFAAKLDKRRAVGDISCSSSVPNVHPASLRRNAAGDDESTSNADLAMSGRLVRNQSIITTTAKAMRMTPAKAQHGFEQSAALTLSVRRSFAAHWAPVGSERPLGNDASPLHDPDFTIEHIQADALGWIDLLA